jgi:hypothetical protein
VETQKLSHASNYRGICPCRLAIFQNRNLPQRANKWIYDAFENTDEITLNSLGVHFSIADAYTDVEFEEPVEEV